MRLTKSQIIKKIKNSLKNIANILREMISNSNSAEKIKNSDTWSPGGFHRIRYKILSLKY